MAPMRPVTFTPAHVAPPLPRRNTPSFAVPAGSETNSTTGPPAGLMSITGRRSAAVLPVTVSTLKVPVFVAAKATLTAPSSNAMRALPVLVMAIEGSGRPRPPMPVAAFLVVQLPLASVLSHSVPGSASRPTMPVRNAR